MGSAGKTHTAEELLLAIRKTAANWIAISPPSGFRD
jgi:hypothetical protein